MTLPDLIARLEKAEEGSSLLDAEIQFHLDMADRAHEFTSQMFFDGGGYRAKIPATTKGDRDCVVTGARKYRYTSSIEAGLTLVPRGHRWDLESDGTACIWREKGGGEVCGFAPTPALALCLAALKARLSVASHHAAPHRVKTDEVSA